MVFRLQRPNVLLLLLNILLLGTCMALVRITLETRRQQRSMESTLELVASEIRFQNHRLEAELISSIRREIEQGLNQHEALIPVVNRTQALADTVANNRPAAVNQFIYYADSLIRILKADRQLVLDSLAAPQRLTAAEQRLYIRLAERTVLQSVKLKTVRILSVADTLQAFLRPQALHVTQGEPFITDVVPVWSASGFHPGERYQYVSDLGRFQARIPPSEAPVGSEIVPDFARLEIPTDGLLPEGLPAVWVDFTVTVSLQAGFGPRRVVQVPGKFLVERGCE